MSNMSNTLDLSTSTTASPSTRRSTRPKRSSDTPKPSLASSVSDTGMSGLRDTFRNSFPRRNSMITQSNPHPWMHPQELRYICDEDFPQNALIQYMCSKAFSVPPREANSTIQLFRVTTCHGTVGLPRGYRVPLMFVAKFQWDSLKLVLTSPDPKKEWDEYKFDIIHLSRLCERLFFQAMEAQKQAVATGTKGIDRLWRSPTFDRVLTRFYHRWFVSREWSIRKFWEEFDDEEYDCDILKHDWARWALKGHKGFTLTKDVIHKGITAQQFMHGLSKNPQGTWIWDESLPPSTPAPFDSQPSGNENPIIVEDHPNSNGTTLAQLEKVFDVRMDTGTPSHNTIEVKKERLEVAGEGPPVDKPADPLSGFLDAFTPNDSERSQPDSVTNSVVDSVLGTVEHPTSPVVGQKRPRSPSSIQGRTHVKVVRRAAWKSVPRPPFGFPRGLPPKSPFGSYLKKFQQRDSGQLFENMVSGDSSISGSDGDETSSSAEDGDDPNDGDYRGPRLPKAKASQLPSKSGPRLDRTSYSPPIIALKIPTASVPTNSSFIGSSHDAPGVLNELKAIPATTNTPGSRPLTDTLTSSSTDGLSISETRQPPATASTAEPVSSGHGASSTPLALPPPQNDTPTLNNSSNADTQKSPASTSLATTSLATTSLATTPPPSQDTLPDNVSEASAERMPEGVVTENLSEPIPAAETEMHDSPSLNIYTPEAVEPDSAVDRNGDHPECSAGKEPMTPTIDTETQSVSEVVLHVDPSMSSPISKDSAGTEPMTLPIDTQTPPITEVVLQVNPLASLSTSGEGDHMDIDEPVPTNDSEDLQGMLASLLSDPRETTIRRAVCLLRGLLHGQSDSSHPSSSSDVRCASMDGEEPFVMGEHLELVAKCSSLLSKYAAVYKGRELEERIIELDERLQQELSNRGIAPESPREPAANSSSVRVDKEVATMAADEHSELQGQGQDIMEVEKPNGIMQDPASDAVAGHSLTPEATMVDLSSVAPTTTSTDPDILKIELISGTVPPATRLITSMMRNLADLLDCTCGGDSNGVKGKGRAQDAVCSTTIGSPLVGPLLNEFTSTMEELQKSHPKSKEGFESIARLHRAGVNSLREQIKATEDKYRRDSELLRERHREEMDSVIGRFCEAEKQRVVEADGMLPSLEMLELRRRVAALENRTRPVSHSSSQAGPSTLPARVDEPNATRPLFHPLGHLFNNEEVPLPDAVTSASKPCTPVQFESSNARFIDPIPLPIKSQRKFQSMHRTSLA